MTERAGQGADLLYGVPKIAEALGIRERQARHLCEKGTIPTFKIGHMVCASRADVAAWLNERRSAALRERRANG